MTRTALKTGVALLCIASLMGCKQDQTSIEARINCPPPVTPPAPVALPPITDKNEFPIPVQSDCVNVNTQVPVVHITLWNVDDPHLESSVLLQYKSDQFGNLPKGRTVQPNPTLLPYPTPLPAWSTRIDFDARPYLTSPGKVVLIEVDLQDPAGYVFAPGTDTAVFTSKEANGRMFCVKAPMIVHENQRWVRFYAHYVPPVGGKSVYGAYHFHIQTRQGDPRVLPLDPAVQNNG
jgi:hypothetical protein